MASIPQFTSKELPSGQTGETFISPAAANVGAGIEESAVAGLGQDISQLGIARHQMLKVEGTTQAATARRQANSEIAALESNLKDDGDVSGYQEKYDEAFESLIRFTPSNAIGAQEYDNWLAGQEEIWRTDVSILGINKTKQIAEGAFITNSAAAITNEDLKEANKLNDDALVDGIISPKEHAKRQLSIPNEIATTSITKSLNIASESMVGGEFSNALLQIEAAELKLNASTIDTETEKNLRSRINTSRKKIETQQDQARKDAVDRTTAETVAEFYRGTLEEPELERRFKSGLIDEDDYLKMVEDFNKPAPDNSDIFIRSAMNTAVTDFKAGSLSKNQVQGVFLDSYKSLNIADRTKFQDDIEREFNAGIQNSVKEAKARGKEQLVNIKFQDPFGFASLDNEEQRLADIQWRNLNLYEDAIDDWIQSQAEQGKNVTPSDIRKMRTDLLIDYKKTSDLKIEAFESAVSAAEATAQEPLPPAPIEQRQTLAEQQEARQLKPIKGQSVSELQKEKAELLKLRNR